MLSWGIAPNNNNKKKIVLFLLQLLPVKWEIDLWDWQAKSNYANGPTVHTTT